MKDTVKIYIADFAALLRNRDFIIYVVKCLIGALFCYFLYKLFPQHQLNWSIISVLLVLSPDHKDSVNLAVSRIKANIIGASVGLCAFLIHPSNAIVLACAIVATIFICYFLKLAAPARSALAALIIVLIPQEKLNTEIAALERMICVILGCAVGLIITYAFAIGESKKTVGKGELVSE
jgi:uncharacterized membrane protein YgaE (UPF0421/DUF939 family)